MIRDTVAFKPIYQAVADFAKATQAYRTALALGMPVDAVLDASERNAKKLEDAITAYAAAEVAKERAKCALIARLWGETHEPGQTVNARNAASKIARGIEGQDKERL